jgi:sulfur-oxidizing protein SoxY
MSELMPARRASAAEVVGVSIMWGAVDRRLALVIGAAAVAAGLGWPAGPAQAANDYADEMRKFTGGKEPVAANVRLELPELAENGNTVPLSVTVDGETTQGVRVEEILILAPNNPNARVALFRFSAMSVAEASTRIRLAETQNVIAVVKMNDGSFFSGAKEIKVTIGGCGG